MADTSTARARAYDLLGELMLAGPVGDLRGYVSQIDGLAAALAPDDEAAAVEHHRVLVDEVFPYAGVFLGLEAQIGEAADPATDAYLAAGWGVDPTGPSPDHVGHALRFLAHLTRLGAEAQAARFLDEQLLPWLPALQIAVASQGAPFYEAVVTLALETALDHRAALPVAVAGSPLLREDTLAGLLDQPKTGLKRLSRRLLIPALSGMFLSVRDITRVARSVELPRGFGSRAKMLESLLFSAVEHDLFEALVPRLRAEVDRWERGWEAAASASPDALGFAARAWIAKLEATGEMLERLAAGVALPAG